VFFWCWYWCFSFICSFERLTSFSFLHLSSDKSEYSASLRTSACSRSRTKSEI
jgi:hypothetical protein